MHDAFVGKVHFLDVVVRQAHPGPNVPAYRDFASKMHDAERYQREDQITWPVLVDDVEGTTHQVYGGFADPTYLIDRDGRVAFCNLWTYAPTLYEAINALLEQGGRGVVNGGLTRGTHLGPSMTDGWRGLQRGLPQSFWDLMASLPLSPVLPWLGYQIRPVLAPLTLRAKPLNIDERIGLLIGAGVLASIVGAAARRSSRRNSLRSPV